ncbi:MAG: imelysin family protein [Aureispira sp.]
MNVLKFSLLLLLLGMGMACQRPGDNSCATDFDQLSLLENVGDNIILPSYQALANETTQLETDALAFLATPSVSTLTTARAQFKKAWLAWQTAAIFEFGPADQEDLRNYCNNFPANLVRIRDGVATGTYDLSTPAYSFGRGFPALDYLLHGENMTDADIVDWYTTDTNASNRQQYLADVLTLLKQKTTTVWDAWSVSGGNYINTFTTTEGVANGKPLSDLVNQWNKNAELIKNNRLGDPISAKTGYIPLLPDNVEAFYSKYSLELVTRAVEAQQAVFLGSTFFASTVENGVGLDDYIEATGAQKGDKSLAVFINEQYTTTLTALQALQTSNNLYDAINNNLNGVKAAYAAAQNQVVSTKTDLPAALCVSITYIDNVDDGD